MAARGRIMLEAMASAAESAGVQAIVRKKGYRGDCELLMIYGTGHPVRRHYWQQHCKRGGAVAWDLGYWDRMGEFSMRLTLNGDHPPRYMREEPPERWEAQGIELREDFDPNGPIILVGMGRKAAELHAGRVLAWEARMLQKLRQTYPGKRIVFRPKRIQGPFLPNVPAAKGGPISEVLKGASLVVCRHSNVAVDACIAGVPVVCEDGAASALYGNDLANPKAPDREARLKFMRGLAYWNWRPSEAKDAWTYLLSRL